MRRQLESEGIQERNDHIITRVLMYASKYWADHLKLGLPMWGVSNLVGEAVDFINNRFLYWIDVFSVKNQMCRISGTLRKAANWAKVRTLVNLQRQMINIYVQGEVQFRA